MMIVNSRENVKTEYDIFTSVCKYQFIIHRCLSDRGLFCYGYFFLSASLVKYHIPQKTKNLLFI